MPCWCVCINTLWWRGWSPPPCVAKCTSEYTLHFFDYGQALGDLWSQRCHVPLFVEGHTHHEETVPTFEAE